MKSKKEVKFASGRRLAPNSFKEPETRGAFNVSKHPALSRSLQFMAQNYTQPIQLDDLVEVSGMSRRGLAKAFTRHIGCSPGTFMRQARIEFAKRLLIEQDLPLKTIATIIGFRSENTFCIAFHRETGMAPKRFARQVWLSAYRTTGIPAKYRQINSNEPQDK